MDRTQDFQSQAVRRGLPAGGNEIRTLGPSREGSAGKVEHLDEVGPSSRTLRERRLPRNMDDRQAMMASLDRLEALERGGARIFFGHDPEFWRTVPQGPTPIA